MINLLLLLIFARPFICSLAYPYANSVFSSIFIAMILAWLLIKKPELKIIKPIERPLAFFILAVILSIFFSKEKVASLNEIYKYTSAIFLIIFAATLSDEDRENVLSCIILGGFLISILAIYQYFFGFQHILGYMKREGISSGFALDYVNRRRIFFPFVTPNLLGGYLAMIIPLTLCYKNKVWMGLPLSFALLLTGSLGAFFSIFFALTIYFYLRRILNKRHIVLLCGILFFAGLIFFLRGVTEKHHLRPIFSALMRLVYWRDTLQIIKAHSLFGAGLGNFNLSYSRYAHNSYLQIWAETGIIGLGSFLWLIFVVLKSALKKLKNPEANVKVAAFIAAAVVFLLHNIIDFSFYLPEASFLWWLILGFLVAS